MNYKNFLFFHKFKLLLIYLFLLLCHKIMTSNLWLLSPIPDEPNYPTLGTTLLDIKDYDDAAYIMTTNEEIRASTAEGLGDPYWYNDFYYQTQKDNKVSTTKTVLPKNAVFASFGESFVFVGCDSTYLISYFDSSFGIGGIVKGLYQKSNINLREDEICSISYLDYFVFLVHTMNDKLYFHRIKIEDIREISNIGPTIDEDYNPTTIYFEFAPYTEQI